jgi:hypothetical protein
MVHSPMQICTKIPMLMRHCSFPTSQVTYNSIYKIITRTLITVFQNPYFNMQNVHNLSQHNFSRCVHVFMVLARHLPQARH